MSPELLAKYSGKSVLITGGLGFVGSNLARALVETKGAAAKVTILDSLEPGLGGNPFNVHGIEDRVTVQIGDMANPSVTNPLVWGVDYIFNLAGNCSHLDSMNHPHHDLEMNCAAQLTLLEACRHVNRRARVVFSSTRQVYGKPQYLPVDELHPIVPVDVNGVNQIAAEHYHLLYHRLYGIDCVVLRLTNTYGPQQLMSHNRQCFIAWFIRQAIDGGEIQLFGGGSQRRDLNYIDDVVEALLLAGLAQNASGEVYNLGSKSPTSLAECAELLVKLSGRGTIRDVPFPAERKVIDIGDFYASPDKIAAALGWSPKVGLDQGLARTIAYYEKNREHYWDYTPYPAHHTVSGSRKTAN